MCYFFDKKFERGHRHQCKRPKIDHVEVEVMDELDEILEEEVEEVSTELAHISLNTITGFTAFPTITCEQKTYPTSPY